MWIILQVLHTTVTDVINKCCIRVEKYAMTKHPISERYFNKKLKRKTYHQRRLQFNKDAKKSVQRECFN
jgi:hypothetical protein